MEARCIVGLENIPDENLEILFDEIIAAPSTEELLIGLYEVAFPFLKSSLQEHLEITNPLADHPSVRIIRFALLEIEEMILFGKSCLEEIDKKNDQMEIYFDYTFLVGYYFSF